MQQMPIECSPIATQNISYIYESIPIYRLSQSSNSDNDHQDVEEFKFILNDSFFMKLPPLQTDLEDNDSPNHLGFFILTVILPISFELRN